MNAEINELRQEISRLDKSLLEILEKRFEICVEIGNNKKQNGLPIEDLTREKAIIEDKVKNSHLNKEFTKRLFELIFKESKRLQNDP
jgi:chorismate mutase